jgi:hypothetical protein
MAKKTIRISDVSGEEIQDGKGATVRITFADARKVCENSTSRIARPRSSAGDPLRNVAVGQRRRLPRRYKLCT